MHEPRNGLPAAVKMWPTPTTNPVGGKNIDLVDKTGNPPEHPNQRFFDKRTGRLVQKGLETVAKMWPTPRATEYKNPGMSRSKREKGMPPENLTEAVKMWPPPTASDHKGSGQTGTMRDRLDYAAERPQKERISGQLNPQWVEWLMGFPDAWTDLED